MTHTIRTESAITKAAKNAEFNMPNWIEGAAEHLRQAAASLPTGESANSEQLRLSCGGYVTPPSLRAWGAATRLAVKNGYIVHTGRYSNSEYGTPKPVYRYNIENEKSEVSKIVIQ